METQRTQQSQDVRRSIVKCISEEGLTDKQQIYSRVVEDLGVPRPTVRRVACLLRKELAAEIVNLENKLRDSKEQLQGIS